MMSLLFLPGTFPAETVDDRLAAVHRECVFVPEMREDFLHERAVHVEKLPASATFEMDMQVTSGGVELVLRALAAASGEFFQFALVGEGSQCAEDGRFAGIHLPDQVTRGKAPVPRKGETT